MFSTLSGNVDCFVPILQLSAEDPLNVEKLKENASFTEGYKYISFTLLQIYMK